MYKNLLEYIAKNLVAYPEKVEISEVESDGTVRDSSGYKIGEIESDGTVRDSSGCKIGEASGMSKEQAAYHFFFK